MTTPNAIRSPARTPRASSERETPVARERVPFGGARPKLDVGVESLRASGYHVHWFNDEDSRLLDAEAAAYTFVTYGDLDKVGAQRDEATREARADERVPPRKVGTIDGAPLMAYLMKIPLEYFEQDEQAKFEQDAAKVRVTAQGLDDENMTGEGRIGRNISIKTSARL